MIIAKLNLSVCFFAISPLLFSVSGSAETVLEGDYHISAESTPGTEVGNLSIDGGLSVGFNIDFGSTIVSSVVMEAVVLAYGESGTDYNVDAVGVRDAVTFRWQENGAGLIKTKMSLGAANDLTLLAPEFNPSNPDVGRITITPSTAGSSLMIDGASVVTSTTYAGTGGILSLNAADDRYVPKSHLSIGTATESGDTGPTVALFGATATKPYTFAGPYASATGYASTAISGAAGGIESSAFGTGSSASGNYSTALGAYSYASEWWSTAVGHSASATGADSMAIGNMTSATGIESVALGYGSVASGRGSVAFGVHTQAIGEYSTAVGPFTTSRWAQFVVGSHNVPQGSDSEWISTDDLFIIGNGDPYEHPSSPSNAFTVKKNGNTWVSGGLTVEHASRFNGRVRIEPQGDLSMGDFTSEPAP